MPDDARILVVPPGAEPRWLPARWLRAGRPEVVQLPSLGAAERLAPTAQRLGCAVIAATTAAALFEADPAEGSLESLAMSVDVLRLPDDALSERALSLGWPDGATLVEVPPAPDAELLHAGGRDAVGGDGLSLCSIGELSWTEGHEHALMAVRHLLERGLDCHLSVIGTGPHLDTLLIAHHQLGLEAVVEFVTDSDRAELRRRLRAANAYLHCAVVPGLTPGLAHSAGAGLPVVATDAGALVRDLVGSDVGNPVVPRRDPMAVADRLMALDADRDLGLRLGERSRERAIALLTGQARSDAIARLYERALDAGRSRKSAPNV